MVDPVKLFGAVVTDSVPLNRKSPPFVKLESVKLNPARVRVAPELTASVEIVTLAVKVGMLTGPLGIIVLSTERGTIFLSQLLAVLQSVSAPEVPPTHVKVSPPPKFQFTLFPKSVELVA